jgi:hypothetical protein
LATCHGHGFADDLSLATGSPTNMTVKLEKLSIFSACTGMTVNVRYCCITGALWSKGNALSPSNRTLFAFRLQKHFVTINTLDSPIPSINPSESSRVLGAELNTTLTFTKHWQELKRTTTTLINALSSSPHTRDWIRHFFVGFGSMST